MHLVIFKIDEQQFALDLEVVERVVRVVEITQLPNAPEQVLGAINLSGNFVPVVNMRKLLGIKDRNILLSDQLILCKYKGKKAALWVDQVKKIASYENDELVPAREKFPDLQGINFVVKDEEKITLVYQIENLSTFIDSGIKR